MDSCGFSCFTWLITACRCATEVAATLFLTQRSPPLTAHKTVLIRRLSPQALGSELAQVAQTPPPLVSPIPVSSARLDWELDCALDTPALVASRRLPVGEQWSTSILGCVVCLACCISLFSLYCSIQHCSADVDFDGGVVTWVQSKLFACYIIRKLGWWTTNVNDCLRKCCKGSLKLILTVS